MASASALVPPVPADNILEILHAFQRTEILQQAIKFGVFDKLEEAGKPVDVEKLAKDLDVLPHTLERLMNACTGMGLLVRTKKGNQIFFTNSQESKIYLTTKSRFNMLGLAGLVQAVIVPGYKLEEPIKTGKQHVHKTLDFMTAAPEDFFKTLYGTKERYHFFVSGMDGYAKSCLQLLAGLKLDTFKHAVDLGGSFGTHARLLKKMYKGMKVTLADLPPVIQEAKKQDYNKAVGIDYAECDFFDGSTMPKADLYLLGHVCHDWTDSECAKIAKNVFDSLNKGGAILILDKVLKPNKDGPQFALQQDLTMLVVTNGKERTEEEFKQLLINQGFKRITCKKDEKSPYYDAIMAYKV